MDAALPSHTLSLSLSSVFIPDVKWRKVNNWIFCLLCLPFLQQDSLWASGVLE
jgi:hypothetical protein